MSESPHETRELNLAKLGMRGQPQGNFLRTVPNVAAESATHGSLVGNHAALFFEAPPRLYKASTPLSASLRYLFAASIYDISNFRSLGIFTLEQTEFSENTFFCRFAQSGLHVQLGHDPSLRLQIVFESQVVKALCMDQGLDFYAMRWIPLPGASDASQETPSK